MSEALTMKLLVKKSGNTSTLGGNDLPVGVRLLETLTSGFRLVDATTDGAERLRKTDGLIVKTLGAAFITPPGEFEMRSLSDIQIKLDEVKARQAKSGPR